MGNDQRGLAVVPPIFAGRTVFVVAPGPSLADVDLRRLDGRAVIAVNRAFELLPRAQIVYFSDLRFSKWYERELLAHPGLKITCQSKVRLPDVVRVKQGKIHGLPDDPSIVSHGNCSGYAAINVAVHTEGRPIILLGFDMKLGPDGRQHVHSDHPIALRQNNLDKMLPWFKTLVEPMTRRGITCLNATEGSAIDCFPRIPTEDALSMPD